jgi:prepilin-type processing-associated H-X9-DG protein
MALFTGCIPDAAMADLKPYLNKDPVGGEEIFIDACTLKPFVPNPTLVGKGQDDIVFPGTVAMFYEMSVGSDGLRGVLFMDGHVKRFPEDQWQNIKAESGIL